MERKLKDSGIPWIGQIPEHWKSVRFKSKFATRKGLSITKADLTESGIPVINYGQIHSKHNNGTTVTADIIKYVPQTYLQSDSNALVDKGDFIFADTSEDIVGCGNCAYIDCDSEIFGGYHTIIASGGGNNKYFSYLFLTDTWRSQIRCNVTGIKVFSISQSILANTRLIAPPVAEQEAIAAYLDKKCGEIDELIEVEQQMISELELYRQSVITEAVTHGLNPDAELKDSGIYWIGNIPGRWTIAKMKFFVDISNGSDPKTEGDIPVFGSGATSFKTCGEFKEGPTVLIGRKGATLHIPHYIEGNYWNVDTAFDTKVKGYSLKYFFYIASVLDYKAYISATTLPSMTQSNYENMQIPVPPLSEQQEIADYLDAKCVEIDDLIKVKQEKIENLKQYRQSLIFEAVTGKTIIN